MIGRGADDGQTERHVDPFIEVMTTAFDHLGLPLEDFGSFQVYEDFESSITDLHARWTNNSGTHSTSSDTHSLSPGASSLEQSGENRSKLLRISTLGSKRCCARLTLY